MIRSLVVTDKFAPHAGGTSVVWTEWCRHWPARELQVVTRQFPGWEAFDRRQAYTVRRVQYLDVPKLRMPLLWLQMFAVAARACHRRRQQVLHCGQILETGLYAPWLKQRFGVPYLVHTYGEEISAYGRQPRARRWLQRVLAGASGVTTISHFSEELLRDLIGYTGPVLRVHPGVDTRRFVPGDGGDVRARLGLGEGPLLLTVARLMRRKGHDRVLEALPWIRSRHPDLRYVIAGVGPDEARLQRLVRQRGLEPWVRFLGRVAEADLVPLLQVADVFVHPNRQLPDGDVEGFGIVFLEAGACGVPVIGGNSGGAPDAVMDGVTGFLVDPEDEDELVERILILLEDAGLRARMGQAGREWAGEFSWRAAAESVWALSERAAGVGA